MQVTYDAHKNRRNRQKHGIELKRASEFDMESASFLLDDREDYGEERWIAIGFLDARLYVLIFTLMEGGIRAISLRRAEKDEERDYAEN